MVLAQPAKLLAGEADRPDRHPSPADHHLAGAELAQADPQPLDRQQRHDAGRQRPEAVGDLLAQRADVLQRVRE